MLAIGNAAEARQRPKGEKEASRGPPWVHGCSIHASRTAESVLPFQGGYRGLHRSNSEAAAGPATRSTASEAHPRPASWPRAIPRSITKYSTRPARWWEMAVSRGAAQDSGRGKQVPGERRGEASAAAGLRLCNRSERMLRPRLPRHIGEGEAFAVQRAPTPRCPPANASPLHLSCGAGRGSRRRGGAPTRCRPGYRSMRRSRFPCTVGPAQGHGQPPESG